MNVHPDRVAPPVKPPPRRGIPGLDARNRGFSAALSPLVSMVFAAGFVLGAVLRPEFLQGWQAALLLFLIALGLFITWKRALLIFLRHEEGARGEEQVARVLDALPDQWQVFHGVPLGEKKLDHVLVGPDQVFSIETVHWRGPVRLVNGKLLHGDQHYPGYDLATLRTRGEELAAELGIPENALTPMVCIVGGRYGEYPGVKAGVWIGEIQDLGPFLLGDSAPRNLKTDPRSEALNRLEQKFSTEPSL